MKKTLPSSSDYGAWLASLKTRIAAAQQRAALSVNRELVRLYWQIGHEILLRQEAQGWGAKVIERLADDLRRSFPTMRGFSRANLMYMRAFAASWTETQIVQQPVGQLPWGHNLILLDKLSTSAERLAYARLAAKNGWSRNALALHIQMGTADRIGAAATNFRAVLPKAQSDLAAESLKDPYKLDFLGLGAEAQEREIEDALVHRMTDFLLELGSGFAFVGRQVHLEVGGDDFFLDLLFYNIRLHRYFVIELKAGEFKPEQLGQLGFYITAVDRQLKAPGDKPTIGLLLCRSRNRLVAEYALQDVKKPIGVSRYELTKALPKDLRTSLPAAKEIEARLSGKGTSHA